MRVGFHVKQWPVSQNSVQYCIFGSFYQGLQYKTSSETHVITGKHVDGKMWICWTICCRLVLVASVMLPIWACSSVTWLSVYLL